MSFRNASKMPLIFSSMIALAPLAIGCDSTETSSPPGTSLKYPTEASFCEGLAEAECTAAAVEACYASDDSDIPSDTKTCVSARDDAAQCRVVPGYEDADTSRAPYHPEAAEACVAARHAAYADAKITREEIADMGKACAAVFSSDGGRGASCTTDLDCDVASDLSCVKKLGESEGLCYTANLIGAGLDCTGDGAVCVEGFYCGSDGACIQDKDAGKACDADKPCAEGLSCSGPEGSAVCVEKTANGSDCVADDECASGFCTLPSGSDHGICTGTMELNVASASCDAFRP